MPPIRYEFGTLGDSSTMLANTANDIGVEKDNWRTAAGLVSETWLDQVNGRFNELSAVWDTAAQSTNDFQLAIASAVTQSQINGEEALAAGMAAFG